jgi:hypothetical protein
VSTDAAHRRIDPIARIRSAVVVTSDGYGDVVQHEHPVPWLSFRRTTKQLVWLRMQADRITAPLAVLERMAYSCLPMPTARASNRPRLCSSPL